MSRKFTLAINGFGRIGRCVVRSLFDGAYQNRFELLAINEPAPPETIAHLLRYDSTHGPWRRDIQLAAGCLLINGQRITLSHHQALAQIQWPPVDLVMDCSGAFSRRAEAEQHLHNGAARVLLSQPGHKELDATIVYGLNHTLLTSEQRIISAASCTTNAVAPVIDWLHQQFGIETGVITTIHSAMQDQPVIDAYHHTDLRKTRSAMRSVIPVETGLAHGIDRVLPQLAGRFEAQAMRVPTIDVSAIDLSVLLGTDVDAQSLNDSLSQAAASIYRHIIGVSCEPLASCDFIGETRSAVVDASQTRVAGQRLAKLLIWFDNEWGYANRMLDVANYWLGKL